MASIGFIHAARGITVHAGATKRLPATIPTVQAHIGIGETFPRPEAEKAVLRREFSGSPDFQ